MADELDACLGTTGSRIDVSNQSDLIAGRAYITEGACLSICVNFMCNFYNVKHTKKKEHIEIAQWIYSSKAWQERVDLLVAQSGLREVGLCKGRLLTEEISMTYFLKKISSKPSFNLFCFYNNTFEKGHALLFYTWDGDDWFLYDPNFGLAKWTHLGGLIIGLKKLLASVYFKQFGPYFAYKIYKYEK